MSTVDVPGAIWIFGYGSLVWRPDFPYSERRPAFVRGWTRRFWQGSTDHRGVPGSPGRVVTLEPEPGERCWGMAYRIAASEQQAVLAGLDAREKGGYERHETRLFFCDARGGRSRGLLYRATASNPNYLGPASLEAIAIQVEDSTGPSGSNLEYVLRLAAALRSIGAEDPHVFALEQLLAARRQS